MNTQSGTNGRAGDEYASRTPRGLEINPGAEPELEFRVDAFEVPEGAMAEFQSAMRRNLAFLETLPGFRGHLVLEKSSGPTSFNIVTIAVWQGGRDLDAARDAVGAYYAEIGFDPQSFLTEHGIRAEIGDFRVQQEAQ